MSEAAALLDEPKAKTAPPEAVATATEPEVAGISATPAASGPDGLDVDALLNEASTLAEAVETNEVTGRPEVAEASEIEAAVDQQVATEVPPTEGAAPTEASAEVAVESPAEAPATPAAESPVTETPAAELPAKESPVVETSAADAPATEAPAEPTNESSELGTQDSASGTESSAPDTDSPPPSADASASTPDTPAANPWADEVAQLENQWAQGKEDSEQRPAASPGEAPKEASTGQATEAAASSTQTSSTETPSADGFAKKGRLHALAPVMHAVLKVPVLALVLLDKPFAKLSPRLKNLLGYVGIATTIVAAACWILATKVRSMLE